MALSVKLYRVVGKGKDRRYIPIDLGRRGQRSKEEVTGPFYLRYGTKYESVGMDFKAAVQAMQCRHATLEALGSGVAVKQDGDPNRKRVVDEVKKFLAKKSLLKDPKTVKTYTERLGYFLDWCERSFRQSNLAHFDHLIWPTTSVVRLVEIPAAVGAVGKVGIARVVRDFQGRWEARKTCFWFSSLSTDRLFPQPGGRRVLFFAKSIDRHLAPADSKPASRSEHRRRCCPLRIEHVFKRKVFAGLLGTQVDLELGEIASQVIKRHDVRQPGFYPLPSFLMLILVASPNLESLPECRIVVLT